MDKNKRENSSKLTELKEELIKILDSRISNAKLNEELSSLSNLSLGGIINVFESISDKLYETKDGKKLIGKYVRTIRESKCLSNVYSTYEIVRKSPNVKNPSMFLSEAISMSKGVNPKEYAAAKDKLANVVRECAEMVNMGSEMVNECAHKHETVDNAIEYLLLNEKKYSNLPQYVNNFDIALNALTEGMKPVTENSENKTGKELIDELNEEISGLKEWETDTVKDITLALLAESGFEELFNQYKNRCMEKLDEAIENSTSIENKSHFETMKSQLMEKEYKKTCAYEDLFTLAELAQTLTD